MSTPELNNIIVQQLERMSTKIDEISKEVQRTNIEMAKLSGMKHTLNDFKTWKEGVEQAVNAEDLRKMKNAVDEVKKHSEEIKYLNDEIELLQKNEEKNLTEIAGLNAFKIKTLTIGSILFVIFSTAITVLGWYIK
jgi:soluble cytochrome b562